MDQQVVAQQRRQGREKSNDQHAAQHQIQHVDVLMHQYLVDDRLGEDRRGDAEQVDHQRGEEDLEQQNAERCQKAEETLDRGCLLLLIQ